jgi:hypothetical protein
VWPHFQIIHTCPLNVFSAINSQGTCPGREWGR